MISKFLRYSLLLALTLCASAKAQTMQYVTEQVFLTAAPDATNQFGFEEFNLALGAGTGPLNTFTEIGYVTFNTNPNYTQQVIDGFNIGQPNNNVYVTNATDHSLTLADITFGGGGVLAVGFDLKSTANASTTGGGAPSPLPGHISSRGDDVSVHRLYFDNANYRTKNYFYQSQPKPGPGAG